MLFRIQRLEILQNSKDFKLVMKKYFLTYIMFNID